MSSGVNKKTDNNSSFHESDSFDEPKGVPISMEPVFSTAAGVRIDVKQESIDKSEKLLSSNPKKSFSSPFNRGNNGKNAFVSPFRSDERNVSSRTSKRTADINTAESEAPLPKKTAVTASLVTETSRRSSKKIRKNSEKEAIEIKADVLRASRIHEENIVRLILQESSNSPLILASCSYRRGRDIKFGDRIHIRANVVRKSHSNQVTEIYIKKVLRNKKNSARPGIRRHSIAKQPFCIKPKFVHELSDESVKKAVLQVNILDLNVEIYNGCSNCERIVLQHHSHNKNGFIRCPHCKDDSAKLKKLIFSRMRVMDFSGQLFVNIATKAMEKVLELLEYEGVDKWIKFKELNERKNYVFRPIMIEIEKSNNEWECTDVANVDWNDFGTYLEKKEHEERQCSSETS